MACEQTCESINMYSMSKRVGGEGSGRNVKEGEEGYFGLSLALLIFLSRSSNLFLLASSTADRGCGLPLCLQKMKRERKGEEEGKEKKIKRE